MATIQTNKVSNIKSLVVLYNSSFTAKYVPIAIPGAGKVLTHKYAGKITETIIAQNGTKLVYENPVLVNGNVDFTFTGQFIDSGIELINQAIQQIAADLTTELYYINLDPVVLFHYKQVSIEDPGQFNSTSHLEDVTIDGNANIKQGRFNFSSIAAIVNALSSLTDTPEQYQAFERQLMDKITFQKYKVQSNVNGIIKVVDVRDLMAA